MNLFSKLGVGFDDAGKSKRELSGFMAKLVSAIAIAMSVYHLYTAMFGTPEWLRHRPLHVVFFLVLGFLLFKSSKRRDNTFTLLCDMVLALASASIYIYITANFKRLSEYMFMVTKLTPMDYFMALLVLILVVEITRRTTGWALIIVAGVFVAQTLFARYFPGFLKGPGVPIKTYLGYMFLTADGLFGSTVNVSSTYVFLFIVFGSFLEATGVGSYFIDIASELTKGLRGGTAKCSILASGLFGSISGSAVANVYATGTFTIPMMKKSGFEPHFSGAVEAVASSGGAIMPPVMGSSAFLMADFLGISYTAIAKAAIIPAILYYLSLWFFVDIEAMRLGMKKVPIHTKADWLGYFKRIYMALPIVVLLVVILTGYSIFRAAFLAILATLIVAFFHDRSTLSLKNILKILDNSGRSAVTIAAPLTCASIVVGTIQLTGVGLKLTSMIVKLAHGQLPLVMLFTMIVTIILGMGLPTPAAYLLVAIFAPSALTTFGIPMLTSHMFCFYYAAFSTITPPVAMAAYAGGNLAGASVNKTGFTAMRLGIAAYIIPWIFTFSGALLLQGSVSEILQAIVTAAIGIFMLASGSQGYFLDKKINWPLRVMVLISALCMIITGPVTDIIGISIFAFLLLYVRFFGRNKTVSA